MSNTIGGFSKEQYESCLYTQSDKVDWKVSHWVCYFNLARYALITTLINRLAYCILHHYEYLNNAFLFKKFKSHDFTTLENKEHYQMALDLFKKFQECPEIDKKDLESVKKSLESVKDKFTTPVKKDESEKTDKDKSGASGEGGGDKGKTPPKASSIKSTPVAGIKTPGPAPVPGLVAIPSKSAPPPPTLIAISPAVTPSAASLTAILEPPKKIVLEPIPQKVQDILNKPFPLSDAESIQDLYEKGNEEQLENYRKNLAVLRQFENILYVENKQTEVSFTEYMQKVDQAYQRAWENAKLEVAANHEDFKKEFGKPAQLGLFGVVICSSKQLEWVQERISNRYPALYELSYRFHSLGVDQEKKLARLVRMMMCGLGSEEKSLDSIDFIRHDKTYQNFTPPQEDIFSENGIFHTKFSFLKPESFTQSLVAGDQSRDFKQQLELMGESFVKYWLQQKGTELWLPALTPASQPSILKSGRSVDGDKAEDWVLHVREVYTSYLKQLDEAQLAEHINQVHKGPYVKAIKGSCHNISLGISYDSIFPKHFLEMVLKNQLEQAGEDIPLKQAIQKTIDQAVFENPLDIEDLSKKSKLHTSQIEPLIRIRVLYLMAFLGDFAVDPIVSGMKERIDAFFDPMVSNSSENPSLVCKPQHEKIVEFDLALDKLTIRVKTVLEKPEKDQSIGVVESQFGISSISQGEKEKMSTSLVDMRSLCFSPFATRTQMDYLTSQLSPDQSISNIIELKEELEKLDIFQNLKSYREKMNTKSFFSTWFTSINEDIKSFHQLNEDRNGLNIVLQKAGLFASYLSTYNSLKAKGQHKTVVSDELDDYNRYVNEIRLTIKTVYEEFGNLYQADLVEEDHNKLNQLYLLFCYNPM